MRVPEHVFDLDHPGHYLRRIKMVSVALPGVTGPHVNVGCTLMLESSKIRYSPLATPSYAEGQDDGRFSYRVGKVEQVATSSGQDSTGMFESNINDPRYLPFEGAGAISTWKIDIPGELRQFDYRTIADVVLTIQYTAREGGSALKAAALSEAPGVINAHENIVEEAGSALLLRASTDFSAGWHNFLYSEAASHTRELDMDLDAERFSYLGATSPGLEIKGVRLILVPGLGELIEDVELERAGVVVGSAQDLASSGVVLGGLPTTRWDLSLEPGAFKVKVSDAEIPEAHREMYMIDDTPYYRFRVGSVRDLLVIVHFGL